jgi:hypothetical protein
MVRDRAEGVNADARELLLCLGEPESEDVVSLACWQKTKLSAVAAHGDVGELIGSSSSRSSHAHVEEHDEDHPVSLLSPGDVRPVFRTRPVSSERSLETSRCTTGIDDAPATPPWPRIARHGIRRSRP